MQPCSSALALHTHLSLPWSSTYRQVRCCGVGSLRARIKPKGLPPRGAFSAPAPTHPMSLLPAAVESTSKKPQGAGKVGDPKHSAPKVQGGSADNLKVSHLIPGNCFLTPGPCLVWGLRLGGSGSWERGTLASLVCLPTSITTAMATAKGAPQIPAAAPVIRKMRRR